MKEIAIMKKLDHPNIIKIHEYFEDEERIYIIMELCKGGELFHKINDKRKDKKRWTERQVCRIIYQLLSALNYMHESGVVHRDIKPENVLFFSPKTDIVKLVDFGTATDIDRANREKLSEHFGSPYYIAPEVIGGEYNHMCDIWSCGIIMVTMLMRRVPFDGDRDCDVIEKVCNTNINFHHKEFTVKSIESVDLLKKMLLKY